MVNQRYTGNSSTVLATQKSPATTSAPSRWWHCPQAVARCLVGVPTSLLCVVTCMGSSILLTLTPAIVLSSQDHFGPSLASFLENQTHQGKSYKLNRWLAVTESGTASLLLLQQGPLWPSGGGLLNLPGEQGYEASAASGQLSWLPQWYRIPHRSRF